MAFNPNAITHADPFGGILSGYQIGADLAAQEQQLELQRQQAAQQAQQFSWMREDRPLQQQLTEAQLAGMNVANALQNYRLGALPTSEALDNALKGFAVERAELDNRAAGIYLQPEAQARAAVAGAQAQYAPQLTRLPLDQFSLQSLVANAGMGAQAAGVAQNWAALAFKPTGRFDPATGRIEVIGAGGAPTMMTMDEYRSVTTGLAGAPYGMTGDQYTQFYQGLMQPQGAGGFDPLAGYLQSGAAPAAQNSPMAPAAAPAPQASIGPQSMQQIAAAAQQYQPVAPPVAPFVPQDLQPYGVPWDPVPRAAPIPQSFQPAPPTIPQVLMDPRLQGVANPRPGFPWMQQP